MRNEMKINLTNREVEAIEAIVESDLKEAIDGAIDDEASNRLRKFNLGACGELLISQEGRFESDISYMRQWKSTSKKAEARLRAERSGRNVRYAVADMKRRVVDEARQKTKFFIDDCAVITWRNDENIRTKISFDWLDISSGERKRGDITFLWRVEEDIQLKMLTRGKPRRAREKAEEDRLDEACRSLQFHALLSLREFLAEGGSGDEVPKHFKVNLSPGAKHLNNYSCNFWLE